MTDSLILDESEGLKLSDSIVLSNPRENFSFVEANPFIELSKLNIKKAQLAHKTARNSRLPTLSLTGGYNTNYSSERTDFSTGTYMPFYDQLIQNRSLYFGFSLSVPIFDTFKIRGLEKKTKVEILIQKLEKDKITLEQEKIYKQSYQELHLAQQEYLLAKKQLISLKSALNSMIERHKLGLSSSTDFSKALLDHNQAEFKVITTGYNLIYFQKMITILQN